MTLKTAINRTIKSPAFAGDEALITEQGYALYARENMRIGGDKRDMRVMYKYYTPVRIRFADGSSPSPSRLSINVPLPYLLVGTITGIYIDVDGGTSQSSEEAGIRCTSASIHYDNGAQFILHNVEIRYNGERVMLTHHYSDTTLDLRYCGAGHDGVVVELNSPTANT